MKEFEKWWESNNEFCHNKSGQFSKEDARDTWRAALEQVYDNLDYSEGHKGIKDIIEQELGDQNDRFL